MTKVTRWNGSDWENSLSYPANMLTTDTAQTVTGQKTFTLAPLIPDASYSIAKISGLQTALDSKYSPSNPPPATGTTPTNMMTTDTAQTVSGLKTFTMPTVGNTTLRLGTRGTVMGGVNYTFFMDNSTSTDGGTTYQAIETGVGAVFGNINGAFGFWTAGSVAAGVTQTYTQRLSISSTNINFYNSIINGTGQWTTTGGITGANIRVTATGSSRWVGSTASGAPTTGTYTLNDWIISRDTGRIWQCTVAGSPGTWTEMSLPAASGGTPTNMVTTDTAQSITAVKTFSVAPVVPDASFAIVKVSGLQAALDAKYSATNPPPASAPTDLSDYVTLSTAQAIAGVKTFSAAPVVPDASWSIAKTSGLQAALDAKYSATNPPPAGTAPANMMTTDTVQTVPGGKTFTGINLFEGGVLFRHTSGTAAIAGFRTIGDAANRIAILANGTIQFGNGTNALDVTLYRSAAGIIATNGIFAATQVIDNGQRVYSPSNLPPAPTNMLTTDTAQSVTGLKTFSSFNMATTAIITFAEAQQNVALRASGPGILQVDGQLNATSGLFDNGFPVWSENNPPFSIDAYEILEQGVRVYSPSNPPPVTITPYVVSMTGTLKVQPGKSRIYFDEDTVITSVRASVDTAPTGAPVIVDVNLNGTTVFSGGTGRPTVAVGTNTNKVDTFIVIAAGQYITVDVDQIGSTVPGADLTVVIKTGPA